MNSEIPNANRIAKYRDDRVPGYWLLTDFTMGQVEKALAYYENRIKELHKELQEEKAKNALGNTK
jgi:hypothetical protein